MRFRELLRPAEQILPSARVADRRRPGRNNQVSPPLIPLLRHPAAPDIPVLRPGKVDAPASRDDLAPVRGIAFSLALSVLLWIWIAGMIVWAVRR